MITPSMASEHSDEAILAHREQIERDVKETQRLIADLEPTGVLAEQYASNPPFVPKIARLVTQFRHLRRTRGDGAPATGSGRVRGAALGRPARPDAAVPSHARARAGNCFYRAFVFSLFERLLNSLSPGSAAVVSDAERAAMQAEFERLERLVEDCLPLMVAAGYPEYTLEDFRDCFLDELRACRSRTLAELVAAFEDEGTSNCSWPPPPTAPNAHAARPALTRRATQTSCASCAC